MPDAAGKRACQVHSGANSLIFGSPPSPAEKHEIMRMRLAIGLGSNLPPRDSWLIEGRREILAAAGAQTDLRQGRVYESEPENCPPGSPPFLNTAMEIDVTGHDPQQFLRICQEIEKRFGRPEKHLRPQNAPRTLDIDLLYIVGSSYESDDLIIPHPRLATRAFVLRPLADIAPNRRIRPRGPTIASLLAALPQDTNRLRDVTDQVAWDARLA